MSHLVSVIVPIYNVERYLAQCIESVLGQTYKNIEIILINDGSTDASLSICKDYVNKDDRIRLVDKKNGGQGAARNIGLEMANGDYVYFVDSDDYIASNLIEQCVDAIIKYGSDIVTFDARVFAEIDAKILYKYKRNLAPFKKYTNAEFFNRLVDNEQFCPVVWLYFYRKNFLVEKKVKFVEGYVYEDLPFTYAVLNSTGSIVYIDKEFCFHRVNASSIMQSRVNLFKIKSSIVQQEVLNNLYKNGMRNQYQLRLIKWLCSTPLPLILCNREYNKKFIILILRYISFVMMNPHLWSVNLLRSFYRGLKQRYN